MSEADGIKNGVLEQLEKLLQAATEQPTPALSDKIRGEFVWFDSESKKAADGINMKATVQRRLLDSNTPNMQYADNSPVKIDIHFTSNRMLKEESSFAARTNGVGDLFNEIVGNLKLNPVENKGYVIPSGGCKVEVTPLTHYPQGGFGGEEGGLGMTYQLQVNSSDLPRVLEEVKKLKQPGTREAGGGEDVTEAVVKQRHENRTW